MKDGILVVNKPQNWTSSDCVAICRRALMCKGKKKVGHGGTLDPMATGLLPIFVGQATRIMEYMDLDFKSYRCEARLGIITDTLDIWGEPLETRAFAEISEDMVREALGSFQGLIEQMPPKYSAVRINGRRLYDYARRGEEIEGDIKPRRVNIREIELLRLDMAEGTLEFIVTCSKGTYVRTICSDLGEKLGCGCTMTALERTAVGNISLESHSAISPLEIKAMLQRDSVEMIARTLEGMLISPDYPLAALGRVDISDDRAVYFSRGNSILWWQVRILGEPDFAYLKECGRSVDGAVPLNARGRSYDRIYLVYNRENGEFMGTGYYDEDAGVLKADKVFVEKR